MQDLDSLKQAMRANGVELIHVLNAQLAGLDDERDKRIAEIRAECVERRKALKAERTGCLHSVKNLPSADEYGQLARASENGASQALTEPEPEQAVA